MKTLLLFVFAAFVLVGCVPEQSAPRSLTYFPTNNWQVVSVTEGEVVVETKSTNLPLRYRVVRATPVTPLTNGQFARVELTLKRHLYNPDEVATARAFPADH